MKLNIKREQAKGKFTLSCRLDISSEEDELINLYNVQKRTFSDNIEIVPGTKTTLKLRELIKGVQYKSETIEMVLNNEEAIKTNCKGLKNFLTAMKNYGGEDTIEY